MGDINNAIENAELAINGSTTSASVSAAGGGPVEVKSEQSTNQRGTSMSNEELARIIAAEQRRANRRTRVNQRALEEVGG